MSIVFIGSKESVFVSRTSDELSRRGHSIAVIDPNESSSHFPGSGMISKILRMHDRYRFLVREIKNLPERSVVVIHFLSLDCFWLVPILKLRFSKVIGLAFGSDVLRRNRRHDPLLAFGLRRLSVVAATNTNVLDALLCDFPFLSNRSPQVIRFGLPTFDAIDKLDDIPRSEAKTALGYNSKGFLVSLGYSASPGQRQVDLIDFFELRANNFPHLNFVIPVQYGSEEIVSKIIDRCGDANKELGEMRFFPLTDFHDPERAALMRRATDVLINHSVSDAFSGTVQEVVYAGNLVLSGSHLPYGNMPGFGSAIKPYDTLEEAASFLQEDRIEKWRSEASQIFQDNHAELGAVSSWDAVYPQWVKLLQDNEK